MLAEAPPAVGMGGWHPRTLLVVAQSEPLQLSEGGDVEEYEFRGLTGSHRHHAWRGHSQPGLPRPGPAPWAHLVLARDDSKRDEAIGD